MILTIFQELVHVFCEMTRIFITLLSIYYCCHNIPLKLFFLWSGMGTSTNKLKFCCNSGAGTQLYEDIIQCINYTISFLFTGPFLINVSSVLATCSHCYADCMHGVLFVVRVNNKLNILYKKWTVCMTKLSSPFGLLSNFVIVSAGVLSRPCTVVFLFK